MTRSFSLLVLAVLLGGAASPRAASSQARGLGAQIDSIFQAWRSTTAPGCVVGTRRGIETMFARGYGMADLTNRMPLSRQTVFEAGPLAQEFTAAAVVLLAQQGKLSLDDDVRGRVPELPDFGSVITIRQLLAHTSGLRDAESLLILRDRAAGGAHTFEEILHLLSRQRSLNFAPGSEQLYSDTDYILAALIVQRVSGQTLPAFSDEHFFKPLGMTGTRWRDDSRHVVRDRATVYRRDEGEYVEDVPPGDAYGPAGLLTTVDDLLVWNDALRTARIEGGRALVDQMESPARLTTGAELPSGLGLVTGSYRGFREVRHDASSAAYASFLARYPEPQVSVAVLCNASEADPASYGRRVAELLLPPARPPADSAVARPAPARPRVAAARLARLSGSYLDAARGRTMAVVASDSALEVGGAIFVPATATSFVSAISGRMDFTLDRDRVRALTTTGASGVIATWVPTTKAAPSPEELRAYAGRYASSELGVDYAIRVNGERLELGFDPRRGRLPFAFTSGVPEVLEPTYPDGFESGALKVRFVRGKGGRVEGMRVFAERARNLEFVKEP